MPRTRTEVGRQAKVDEILDAAVRRLREGGYDGLSMVGIARELGVAQNAVYWYFPSKDHLFVAALERLVRDMFARKPRGDRPRSERVLWFMRELDAIADVRGAMYDRARSSAVVADLVHALEATWLRVLTNVLRDRVPDEQLDVAAQALLATIQGALLTPHAKADRRRLIEYAVAKLAG